MTYDARFKQFLIPHLREIVDIRENVSVGELPLEIDLIIEKPEKMDTFQNIGLTPLVKVFQNTNTNNLIVEYKSHGDKLEEKDLYKIEAYRYHYLYKEYPNINLNDLGKVMIIVYKPAFLNNYRIEKIDEGIYIIESETKIPLIVINELELIEENYFLLLFSSGEKRVEFLRKLLVEKNIQLRESFLIYASNYYYEELAMAAESEKLDLEEIRKKNLRLMMKDMGNEAVMKELIAGMSEEEIKKLIKKAKEIKE